MNAYSKARVAAHVISAAFEVYAIAEIVWYVTHDGEQTLHEALSEWWQETLNKARERNRIRHTRDMIRDLPET